MVSDSSKHIGTGMAGELLGVEVRRMPEEVGEGSRMEESGAVGLYALEWVRDQIRPPILKLRKAPERLSELLLLR